MRNERWRLWLWLPFLLHANSWCESARLREADRLFWTGQGHPALSVYSSLLAEVTGEAVPSAASQEVLAHSLSSEIRVALRFGDHALADRAIEVGLNLCPNSAEYPTTAGEYAAYRGRLDQAQDHWKRALELNSDAFEARFRKIELDERVSEPSNREENFKFFLDRYQESPILSPEDLEWVGRACVRLGKYEWDGAQKVYQQALDVSPEYEPIVLAKGDLWLDRYDEGAAIEIYQSVLKKNKESLPALLGLAEAHLESGNLDACKKAVDKALFLNPSHPRALAILADILFYDEQDEEAEACLRKGFETNPKSIPLHAIATAYAARKRKPELVDELTRSVEKQYGNPWEFHFRAAECLERNYLFREAEGHLLRCLDLVPGEKRSLASLAILRSRISPSSAESALEGMREAFKNDPFHLRLYNMRNLFAKRAEFDRLESEHFLLRIPPGTDWIYGDAAIEALEENFADLCSRFDYRPSGKVLVEMYDDETDLFLRISGLPGMGLGGVSFGDIVVMRAPAKGAASGLNWGNIMRHELTHVFTLGATGARIPRWYTEGVSVVQEWDPGLGGDPLLWQRLQMNDLIPVEAMDAAFHRPGSPETMVVAYAASAEAVRFLEGRFGPSVHRQLLQAFSEGGRTAAVLPQVTGLPLDEVNKGIENRIRLRIAQTQFKLPAAAETVKGSTDEAAAARQGALDGVEELLSKGSWEEALTRADVWLADRPKDVAFLEAKSYAAYRADKKREARKAAESILDITSESLTAHHVLAWLHRDFRRWEQAADQLVEAHRLRPRYAGPGSPISEAESILRDRRDSKRLAEILEQRLALQPNDAKGFQELARLTLDASETKLAEEAVRQAVFLDPFDPETQILQGKVLLLENEWEKSLERFEAAEKLAPWSGRPQLALAEAYIRMGSLEAGRQAARKALELDPTLDETRDILQETDTSDRDQKVESPLPPDSADSGAPGSTR